MTAPAPATPPRRRRAGRPGRGALFLLAFLMAASGALRLGMGLGTALARGAAEPGGAAHAEGDALTVEGEHAALTSAAPQDCPTPPIAVAEALKLREQRLAVQEAALADRQAALALTETAVNERLAKLEKAEADLSATLARSDGAAEGDLARLTTVYETMKPKDASALFAAMDPEFAAGFFGRMKPEAAAAILAGMKPEAAYAISVILAGRNALVPKE